MAIVRLITVHTSGGHDFLAVLLFANLTKELGSSFLSSNSLSVGGNVTRVAVTDSGQTSTFSSSGNSPSPEK